MSTLIIPFSYDVRDYDTELKNFGVGANVSRGLWDDRNKSIVERSEKTQINIPEWSHQPNTGLSTYFRRHNGFTLRLRRCAGTPSGAAEGWFRCSRSRGI